MVKIILLKDVSSVGQRNDVKSVRFGFAKNWLIPQKFAALATPRALVEISRKHGNATQAGKQGAEQFQAVSEALKDLTLVMRPKKTAKGTLYAAVDSIKISEALKKKKIIVDPKMIQIDEPIKKVGEHEVTVAFSDTLQSKLKITIQ